FVLFNGLDSSARFDQRKSALVLVSFISVIALALLNWIPLLKGLAILLVGLLAFGMISLAEIRRRFPIDIIVIVGSALSLAQLMLSTGLSQRLG
ncbi:SLC13 family permease, partial [Vibrio vulnificus]